MHVPPRNIDWLLLTFSLPARQASQRVDVWRKLRRTGALALKGSGHLLPASPSNRERFEWMATAIRGHGGEASVMRVTHIDNLPAEQLVARFVQARSRDYDPLLRDLQKLAKARQPAPAQLARTRRQFSTVAALDFFGSPVRDRIEGLLAEVDARSSVPPTARGTRARATYRGRLWVTRTRPGIDRTSSAWLIRRFIDPDATFAFVAGDEPIPSHAIPFDMFLDAGFGHRGSDCTFETLRKTFRLRGDRVRTLAEAIHDADISDEKFGRTDALGLDRVLVGWAQQGVADDELLRRGMELIEGLYESYPASRGRRRRS